MVSNVFTTVLTIAHAPFWLNDPFLFVKPESVHSETLFLSKYTDKKEFNIHLIGADKPEVSAIESGLIQVHDGYFVLMTDFPESIRSILRFIGLFSFDGKSHLYSYWKKAKHRFSIIVDWLEKIHNHSFF